MSQDFPIKRLICDPYDNRVRERQIKRGILTLEQLAKHIATLPDEAGNAEQFQVELGGDENGEQGRA
jgi:hypothetical protein